MGNISKNILCDSGGFGDYLVEYHIRMVDRTGAVMGKNWMANQQEWTAMGKKTGIPSGKLT